MKPLIIALLVAFCVPAVQAEEAVQQETTKPATAKQKATAARKTKKAAAKKPLGKSSIAAPAPAAAGKQTVNQGLQEWLAKMKKRVSSARAKQNKLVAVAAVRGDEKSDPAPLYWKGNDGEKAVDPTEIEEFNTAVETALKGDPDAAKAKLQQFVSTHPQSPLIPDANETLAKLSTTEPEPTPDPTTPAP